MEKHFLKNYVKPNLMLAYFKQVNVLCSSNSSTEAFEREEEIDL